MEIIIADPCGYCYGVERAVKIAENAAGNLPAATLGPLIHNPQLVASLEEKGVLCKQSLEDFTAGENVIFRSHGVGPDVYKSAKEKKLKIIDATCPNVKISQSKAAKAVEDGYLPIIVGEKNHPEVKSILAFAGKNGIVIEYSEDIGKVPFSDKYAVIIQTTFAKGKFEQILHDLQKSHPGEYRIEHTICNATSQRQKAAVELAEKVDAFIVIGGHNSANTRHLTELVRAICPKCYQIETAAELDFYMFEGCNKIGITAGASTPDRLIKEAVIVMENVESKKSMEGNEFAELLDLSMEDFGVHPGKLVTGKISQVDKDGVYVDFGYTRDGLILWRDWAIDAESEELKKTLETGAEVEAVVIPGSSSEDFVRLSKIRAEKEAAWKEVEALPEGETRPCNIKVLRVIKARNRDRFSDKPRRVVGLGVLVEGVEGFMPASHVELRHIDDFTPYVGQELEAEIIEVDPEKKRMVVSRRRLLRAERQERQAETVKKRAERRAQRDAERAEKKAEAYANIQEGETYEGKVVRIVDFGLFVEVIDGLVGLVHTSELSYDRSAKPEDVAKEGDIVNVFVKKVDEEADRVSLSIKATMPDPWLAAAGEFEEGMTVEGEITRFLPFGALVKLNDDVEGMIHVSEISEEHVEKPEDVLEMGQVVKPVIIRIDRPHRKIGLSLTRAKQIVENNAMNAYMDDDSEFTGNTIAEQLENLRK